MQITQLSVTYSRTQSLPNYSHVKPSATITATLDKDDNPDAAWQILLREARQIVFDEIDDALEAENLSPRHTSQPLYWIASNRARRLHVILPKSVTSHDLSRLNKSDPNWTHWHGQWDVLWSSESPDQRLEAIVNRINLPDGWDLLFCTDGILDAIPPLPAPPAIEEQPDRHIEGVNEFPDPDFDYDEEE